MEHLVLIIEVDTSKQNGIYRWIQPLDGIYKRIQTSKMEYTEDTNRREAHWSMEQSSS